MTSSAALAVVLPLAGAAGTVWTRGRVRVALGLLAALTTAIASGHLAWSILEVGGRSVRIAAPLGLEAHLVADGLAGAMIVMTTVVGVAAAAYAAAEERDGPDIHHRGFWPLWLALWAALHALFLAGDLLTVYLMLEAVGVIAASLVTLGADRPARIAGTRYLYAEIVASATLLVGVGLIWRQTGSLVLTDLAPALTQSPAGWLALGTFSLGLLLKVPLVPLHFWLPTAHALAPSAVSPVLSAVVVKSAFAVLVRLWFLAVPGTVTAASVRLLGVLGIVAMVWGSVAALRATEVKRLIAYSTLAQLGVLFLLPPLVAAGSADAWTGGILYAVAHALAKAAILMAAGNLVEEAGTSEVAGLTGAVARRPMSVLALGIGAASLVGLPPTGGFVGKWYLLLGSLETGAWWWAIPLLAGSLLTAAYLLRLLGPAFAATSHDDEPPATSGTVVAAGTRRRVRDPRDGVALVLAATTVLLGLFPGALVELIGVGAPAALLGGG